MYRLNLSFCLIAVALLTPCLLVSAADDDGKTKFTGEEEILPSEQTIDSQDDSMVANKKSATQSATRPSKESFTTNFNSNLEANTEFSLTHDAKVVLVLNNNKNKFGEFVQPAEESLRRLTRNPDAIDDIIGQFQQLGGGMTQQFMQQVSQTAPDISKSFGQALSEVLMQTNLLASPVNLNLQNLSESNGLDLSQLGQNFLVGATQNLLNANKDQTESDSESAAIMPGVLRPAAFNIKPETSSDQNAANSKSTKNPFEHLVGQSLLPQFPQLPQFGQLNPFGMFGHFSALAPPLMPMGSEISEVRVLPEQYSPYKLTPKQVDHQTMAEMKLRAVLKEALTKKTIPVLWFHMPTNHKLPKTSEDTLMATKLQMFEQQVVNELKQLQELAKMANEMKKAQLQNGAQPTEALTAKLNLFEIPVYDITVGDIEKTLKDEHVIMLMQTLVQQTQNKEFQRHQQATTKYLTDLTGAPIKRQVKTDEDTLYTMEKDDMMKMMAYAYRMAALNGHEMPWLKNKDMVMSNEKEAAVKIPLSNKEQKLTDANAQMNAERKWLEDKQRQMANEETQQRKMFDERQRMAVQSPMRHWSDPSMVQQQQMVGQWQMTAPQMQQHDLSQFQRQMMPAQMQHAMPQPMPQPLPLQMQQPMPQQMSQPMPHPMPQPMPHPIPHPMPHPMPQPMPHPMPSQNEMIDLKMTMHHQDMQRQMMPQPVMKQIPMQRLQQQPAMMRMQWPESPCAQQFQRQSAGSNMPETPTATEHKSKIPQEEPSFIMPPAMMINGKMHEQLQMQKEQQRQKMMPEMRMAKANMQEQRPLTMMSDMGNSTEQRPGPTHSIDQKSQFRMSPPSMSHIGMQEQMNMQRQQQHLQTQSTSTSQHKPGQSQTFESKMPQQTTNFGMPQPGMTNFNTQQHMSMQGQHQQPPNMMPGMRSMNEQRHPSEPKRTEQVTGFGAENKQLSESMKVFENADNIPEKMQRIVTPPHENTGNMNARPMPHMPAKKDPNPQMPEKEEKARFKGVEKLFDNLDLFGNRHHNGWHSAKPVVHNHYYNAGGGHFKAAVIPHKHNYPGPGYVHHPPPSSLPPPHHHHPTPSCYGGGAHGSNAYGSSYVPYRAAVGDEEIAMMLQQQQQRQQPPMPVTFFRK